MASKDYIVSVDHKNDSSKDSEEVKSDLKKIVKKFDGTIKKEFDLINGMHISVPEHFSEKFKESLEFWSLGSGVYCNVEPDQGMYMY